jgi:type V secretory pathway adhesin AidA
MTTTVISGLCVRGNGAPGRAWGRVFGQAMEQGQGGLLSPNFDGYSYGFQTGVDLFESETPSGIKDRFGVFFGYAQAKGESARLRARNTEQLCRRFHAKCSATRNCSAQASSRSSRSGERRSPPIPDIVG